MASSRSIIGKSVRLIRKKLGLSLLDFSILTELSKATIVNIESGKTGYNLNLLDNVLDFTLHKLKQISDEGFAPDPELRDKLIRHYAKDPHASAILNKNPNIIYALNEKVFNSDFLNQPKEITEIKDYLSNYGWPYNGTSISIALKRLPTKILIEPHPFKKGTFIYSKKKAD